MQSADNPPDPTRLLTAFVVCSDVEAAAAERKVRIQGRSLPHSVYDAAELVGAPRLLQLVATITGQG